MTDTPNSDARPPGNAWVARCFERRPSYAAPMDHGPVAGEPDTGSVVPACDEASLNSSPTVVPVTEPDGGVLFERASVSTSIAADPWVGGNNMEQSLS